ncbi:MAG: amino acid ABC transporter permease, partial [Candidatus Thorarchaeota archaeon]|nr:amino acid ABC transporter permease [Candidatus Thorarchaeota archaeon]
MKPDIPVSQFHPLQVWDFSFIIDYGDHIIAGFGMTMYLYLSALAIGFLLGLLLAISRTYGGRILSRFATGYIELVRSTPMLVQLFLIWILPFAISGYLETLGYPPFYTYWEIKIGDIRVIDHNIFFSIIALSLNSAAYQAEYFRGAIGSIGSGQIMAARSIGMSQRDGIRHIIIPQSLRRVIPAWSNEAAYLPKYTVVAYYIGVEELFAKAHLIVTRTFQALPAYLVIALIFLVLITLFSKGLDILHEKTKI